jgi:hypothetical protein
VANSRQLASGGSRHCIQICIGDVSIQIAGEKSEDVALSSGLAAFRADFRDPDIDMHISWVDRLKPFEASRLFDSGAIWRLYARDEGFCFDFISEALDSRPYKRLIVDPEFRKARLEMSSDFFLSSGCDASPLEYPLDELLVMHRLTRERAVELHGTGIVRPNGIANLFVGHSGAGKSTTTRLWTNREPVEVLSDDRIIVRRDKSASHSMRMYGTPWHGEAMFASPNSATLTRIFVLEHGHGNVITRLTPFQAVAELFARSFVPFHRHEYVDCTLDFLQEVANTVPVYRYSFEPDQRAVDKILAFCD